MSRRGGYQAGAAALGGLAAVGVVAAAVTIGVAAAGQTARPARTGVLDASVTGPTMAVTYQVSGTGQRQTLTYWTPRRMEGATPASLALGSTRASAPGVTRTPNRPAGPDLTAPKGIPTASPFPGSPTTGALFYTTGGKGHFCTASVVDSTVHDLALTAAHCVYWTGYATDIEYVPGYHDGKQPYGAWPVRTITVASGWKQSRNPDLDFAFLTLAAADGQQVQAKTGGLTMGFTRWYGDKIEAIGHNDSDAEPVRCATTSFRFRTGQMEFYCHGFWTGTSGGPWIIDYNAKNGTGMVFGVIGGYEEGGDYEWASYSAYFGSAAKILYEQAERAATPPPPTPTPTPSKPPVSASPTASATPTVSPSPSPSVSVSPTATVTASATSTGADTTSYPGATATAQPGAAASATTAPPVPPGSISTAYRAPVLSR